MQVRFDEQELRVQPEQPWTEQVWLELKPTLGIQTCSKQSFGQGGSWTRQCQNFQSSFSCYIEGKWKCYIEEKGKNGYGVLKISGYAPEGEEEMFTFRGNHPDTARGEEYPDRSSEVSLLSFWSPGSPAQVVFQWIVDPRNLKQFQFLFQEGSPHASLCGWTFPLALSFLV